MSKYQVKFYKGNYKSRQKPANKDKCVAYVEQHFNAVENDRTNYSMVMVGHNASQKSIQIGDTYLKILGKASDITKHVNYADQSTRVDKVKRGKRGDRNVRYTEMPAVLLEPLFVSNPTQAEFLKSNEGQDILATVLAETIKREFPTRNDETILIGFSVGHKYKENRPNDRGAAVYGGGTEADYAEKVLILAKNILVMPTAVAQEESISVPKPISTYIKGICTAYRGANGYSI